MATNWPSWLPLRTSLKNLSPYGAPQISDVLSLNTNENPFALPADVVDAIMARLPVIITRLNRYPDRDAVRLRELLSDYINSASGTKFSLSNIWAANGSNEILQTLMLAMGERGALGFTPSYSVHPLIAQTTGVEWFAGQRREDFTLDIKASQAEISRIKPGLTFVTTPNNPTGTKLSISEIEELAVATSAVNGMLVVDEAYAEFSNEPSAVTLLDSHSNIIVVRTMSKAFAFAGARVGYLIARPEVIDACLITRLPYHLSAVTQAIAEVALTHSALLMAEIDLLKVEREKVASALIEMDYQVAPSAANFLLFSGFTRTAPVIWQELVDAGILIRDVGIAGYLRVTIGTPAENEQFLAALKALK
jgi:histidinol-phosphate aminotransferase